MCLITITITITITIMTTTKDDDMKIITQTLRLTGQKVWWFMKNWGVYAVIGAVLGSSIYHLTADYRIKNFEITFMDMLIGKQTPDAADKAAFKMISGAKESHKCLIAVEALTMTLKEHKYNFADVIQVADEQFYKDCQ